MMKIQEIMLNGSKGKPIIPPMELANYFEREGYDQLVIMPKEELASATIEVAQFISEKSIDHLCVIRVKSQKGILYVNGAEKEIMDMILSFKKIDAEALKELKLQVINYYCIAHSAAEEDNLKDAEKISNDAQTLGRIAQYYSKGEFDSCLAELREHLDNSTKKAVPMSILKHIKAAK